MSRFKELGLKPEFVDALEKVGYSEPTPIQEQAIPELLKGSDVIGQAQTGTGKTAAFGLPMLQTVIPERREVQGLVLTPTRELCIQVAQSLRAYGQIAGIDVLATFGGAPIRQQMDRLKTGPQVVVATVGRVLDLHSRHALMFHDARFVVLDEADEMLDLGFLEDVELILNKCPRGRQTALFSATMPAAIAKLAKEQLHDPVTIRVKAPTLTIDTVEHFRVPTTRNNKIDDLIKVLEAERPTQAIVFARTKIGVDRLARDLDRRKPGLRVRALHGDMSQGSRDGVMIAFKDNRVPVLVATDIAARGLDVQNVTHVINYDLPNSAEIYTHRIGRTGRAGRGGRAITLVEPRDKEEFEAIEKFIKITIDQWSAENAGVPAGARPGGSRESSSRESSSRESSSRESSGSKETGRQDGERTGRSRRARAEGADEVTSDEPSVPTVEEQPVEEPPVEEPPQAEPETVTEKQPEPVEASTEFTWGAAPVESDVEASDSAKNDGESTDEGTEEPADKNPPAGVIPSRQEEEQKSEFTWGPPPEDSAPEDSAPEEAAPEDSTPEASATADAASEDAAFEEAAPEEKAAVQEGPESESPGPDETKPESRELRRPRHVKPNQSELDGGFSLLIVKGGTKAGVEPADVIELVTGKGDLTGSDVRRVRVLSRYTLLQVPSDKAASVAGAIEGAELRGVRVAADAVLRD